MKIKYWMTREPVTVAPGALLSDAARLMKERGFKRLPVMDDGRLVGLLTWRHILEAQPSTASTLSKQEARYLLAKLKVSDVMRKDPITVGPDDDALNALVEGQQKGLGVYPVLEGGHLVGIVTASDLFNLVIHVLGARDREDFVYLAEKEARLNDPAYMPRIIALLAGHGVALLSFISFPRKEVQADCILLLRVSPGRRREASELLSAAAYSLLD